MSTYTLSGRLMWLMRLDCEGGQEARDDLGQVVKGQVMGLVSLDDVWPETQDMGSTIGFAS